MRISLKVLFSREVDLKPDANRRCPSKSLPTFGWIAACRWSSYVRPERYGARRHDSSKGRSVRVREQDRIKFKPASFAAIKRQESSLGAVFAAQCEP